MADLLGMHDARYAVEVAAAGGHHLMLSGPKGAGKTTLAERIPGILPDLTARESLELTAIHSLAGALEPGDDLLTRPPVLRAPPRRQQGQPDRRRHRPGATRRGQPRALRGAVPRRVPALPHRRDRGAAPAARERRGDDRARRRLGHLPGPRDGRGRLQPVPLRRLLRRPRHQPLHVPRGQAPHLPARITGPIADRIDIVRHVTPIKPHDRPEPWTASRVHRRRSGPGSSGAVAPGGPLRRPQLAAQRPDPRSAAARRSGRSPARRSAGSTTSSTPVG